MESPAVKKPRMDEDLAKFWQSLPSELKIGVLSYLPSPDKFVYRRVSKEWASLLEDTDVWIRTTRLTLVGNEWGTNADVATKEVNEESSDDAYDGDDVFNGEEEEPYGKQLAVIVRRLTRTAPIRSLEIINQNIHYGLAPDSLVWLGKLATAVKQKTSHLVSLTIANIMFSDSPAQNSPSEALRSVASLIQSQCNLERLILGPFIEVYYDEHDDHMVSLPKTLIHNLENLDKLRVFVLYKTCTYDLRELSSEALSRLRVLAVFKFYGLKKKAEDVVRDKAPHLRLLPDNGNGLVWTSEEKETSDANALVGQGWDSVNIFDLYRRVEKSEVTEQLSNQTSKSFSSASVESGSKTSNNLH